MPTYEYVCEKCQDTFDAFQSMKDDAFAMCPKDKCLKKRWGKGRVQRAIGAGAGLLFKGDGFYITDYRSDGYQKAAKADKPSSSGGESKSKKSDSKKKSSGSGGSKSASKKK